MSGVYIQHPHVQLRMLERDHASESPRTGRLGTKQWRGFLTRHHLRPGGHEPQAAVAAHRGLRQRLHEVQR